MNCGKIRLAKYFGIRFITLITLILLFYLLFHPFEKFLIIPTVRTSALLSYLIFKHVQTLGNSIIINGITVRIEGPCTPTIIWALLWGYLSLEWKGKKTIILLLLGMPFLFVVNALRIPLIVILVKKEIPFWKAHQIAGYLIFFIAFLVILLLNERNYPFDSND